MKSNKKRKIAVTGSWLPIPLAFLRSRACAEMSPHEAKLLWDLLAMLGPNATGNGDLSLAPSVMAIRGWSGRSTLQAAVKELAEAKLLIRTRQGGRLDCSLWALTLYPLDCDLRKIDIRPGSYISADYGGENRSLLEAPTLTHPAIWRRARKGK